MTEHWFDRLAEPHTRRTTIKAGVLGGAALVAPLKWWASVAWAGRRPCTTHCIQVARKHWGEEQDACDSRFLRGTRKAGYAGLLPAGGGGGGALLFVLATGRAVGCYSSASLAFNGGVEQCFEPHCGNPTQYPGTPPPPKSGCDPGYLLCGEECCDTNNAYCAGCTGGPVCCRIGGNCCPSSG